MAYYYFLKVVVYQYGQSRISGGFGPLRMIESDGSEVNGSDVIGPEVTGRDVTEVCSTHARIFPAFFSYYSSSTKCTILHNRHGNRM